MESQAVYAALYNKIDFLNIQSTKIFPKLNYSIPDNFTKINPIVLKNIPTKNLSLLHLAAITDSLEVFIYITKYKKVNPLIQSYDNYNPLHYACLGNSIEVATYIISHFPDLPSHDTPTKLQYIYLASVGNSPTILKLLFEHGAKLNSPKNSLDKPIQVAIRFKHISCLKLLLKYSPRSMQGSYNDYSPLMLAIINNQQDAVSLLLENGADPSVRASDGNTALSLNCFSFQNLNVMKLLCDSLINVDIPDEINGLSAVHWICQSGSVEICKMILDRGINVNRIDEHGRTGPYYLVDIGTEDNQLKILELLYEHGLDINFRSSQRQNSAFGIYVQSIKHYPKIIDWFLSHGGDINIPLIDGTKDHSYTIRSKLIEKAKSMDRKAAPLLEILKKHNILK